MKQLLFSSMLILLPTICYSADQEDPALNLSTLIHQSAPHSSKLSDIEGLLNRNAALCVQEHIEKLKKEESRLDAMCNQGGNCCCCCGVTFGLGTVLCAVATQCAGTLPLEYASSFIFPAGVAIGTGLLVKETIDGVVLPKYHHQQEIRKQLEAHQTSVLPQMNTTNLRNRRRAARQNYYDLV